MQIVLTKGKQNNEFKVLYEIRMSVGYNISKDQLL